ncbi:MAG: lipid-A-disaccharide synthase [Parachlamydiaceae bacterium]|nr:lipid-A-disaccharide synthase [Parachlamydiaceae bacterium]
MRLFLFAGEPSGDLHGSHLLEKLQKQMPSAEFFGIGGPKMRSLGFEGEFKMEDFAVMGFSDVFYNLSRLIRQFNQISRNLVENNPTGVILIDYPDFNLRLAARLRKRGYKGKIIHYISPTVWAWRKGRIHTMARNLDLLLTIYPFEADCYKESSLPVTYVGNPLVEYLSHYEYDERWKEKCNIPADLPVVALFPGSREHEILRNLPLMLQAVRLLLEHDGIPRTIAISCKGVKEAVYISQQVAALNLPEEAKILTVPHTFTYELMRDCHVAIAKSGTVTLELALHHRPTVVIYQLSALNYFIAQYCMRLNLPYYCMANILLGKELFPECIGRHVSPQTIFEHLEKLDRSGVDRSVCLRGCQVLSTVLHGADASEKAAKAVARGLM